MSLPSRALAKERGPARRFDCLRVSVGSTISQFVDYGLLVSPWPAINLRPAGHARGPIITSPLSVSGTTKVAQITKGGAQNVAGSLGSLTRIDDERFLKLISWRTTRQT